MKCNIFFMCVSFLSIQCGEQGLQPSMQRNVISLGSFGGNKESVKSNGAGYESDGYATEEEVSKNKRNSRPVVCTFSVNNMRMATVLLGVTDKQRVKDLLGRMESNANEIKEAMWWLKGIESLDLRGFRSALRPPLDANERKSPPEWLRFVQENSSRKRKSSEEFNEGIGKQSLSSRRKRIR